MLIINADDWGRTREETDAALECFRRGRITSATAMVFMDDSERAVDVARDVHIDIGLHLNLSQPFASKQVDSRVRDSHERVVRYLTSSRFAGMLYNPALSGDLRRVYMAQCQEFHRLYGRAPSHVDGHHHKHLCMNMLADRVIPGGAKVRRGFNFWPGEKGRLNRMYRSAVDAWLLRRHRSTDYFFALSQCLQPQRLRRVMDLARDSTVELMTHPAAPVERELLLADAFARQIEGVRTGTYAEL
jgi:predicted glycoside hydrolase/deacetylase ChbG (UPF0249 family)